MSIHNLGTLRGSRVSSSQESEQAAPRAGLAAMSETMPATALAEPAPRLTTEAGHSSLGGHFDSNSGRLRELWEFRELLYFLAWRDVKVRYKQTALGVVWAIIQPLFTMLIFTFLFGRLASLPSDDVPRPVFYFSGLLPWLYISATVTSGAMSLLSNSNLLTKIYLPRVILPAAAAVSGLIDFVIGSVVLAALVLWYHLPVDWTILLWPVLVVLMTMLSLGVSMFLAALNVKYRDVKYAVPFGIQLWLFITPVIYPTSMVPAKLQWLLALNPAGGIIEAFRHAIAPTHPMPWSLLGISSAVTVAVFVLAYRYFTNTERGFADIM